MKNLHRLDHLGVFGFAAFLFLNQFNALIFLALILIPDLSFFGYLFGNKIGAISYNIAHSKVLGALLFILGHYISIDELSAIGLILIAHSAMDHILGYGFKSFKGFKYTSLDEL